jgi:hypothetical protein
MDQVRSELALANAQELINVSMINASNYYSLINTTKNRKSTKSVT